MAIVLMREPTELIKVVYVFHAVLAMSAVPFAYLGLSGASQNNHFYLHLYSLFKQVECPVSFVLQLYANFLISEDRSKKDESISSDLFIQALVRLTINLYFTHMVWSADVQMKRDVRLLDGGDLLALRESLARS
jgi:hypothetical protein